MLESSWQVGEWLEDLAVANVAFATLFIHVITY